MRNRDGAGAIESAGAGGDAEACVELLRERRGRPIADGAGSHVEVQSVADFAFHRQAEDAATVADHEIDGFRRGELGSDDEIAFVLAILIIDEHDDASRPQLRQRFVDRHKIVRVRHWCCPCLVRAYRLCRFILYSIPASPTISAALVGVIRGSTPTNAALMVGLDLPTPSYEN